MRLEVGDTLVITGPSGSGKTTLLRSLAELWPFCSGTLTRPCGPNETMFLSQLPYVPLGDLRAVVTYPGKEGTIDDDTLKRTLQKVALPHLVDRLDEVLDWAKVLSPGEQQRIAFARILLTKPKVVFCDEATSALDEGLEFMLLQPGAHGATGHHSGQRQPPQHRRAAPHPRTRAARRRRMATRPGGGRRTRSGVTPRRVASRHGNLHAVPGLGRRADHVPALGGEGMGDRARCARWSSWRCSPGSPPGAASSGASPATISRAAKAFRCGRCWACCWRR